MPPLSPESLPTSLLHRSAPPSVHSESSSPRPIRASPDHGDEHLDVNDLSDLLANGASDQAAEYWTPPQSYTTLPAGTGPGTADVLSFPSLDLSPSPSPSSAATAGPTVAFELRGPDSEERVRVALPCGARFDELQRVVERETGVPPCAQMLFVAPLAQLLPLPPTATTKSSRSVDIAADNLPARRLRWFSALEHCSLCQLDDPVLLVGTRRTVPLNGPPLSPSAVRQHGAAARQSRQPPVSAACLPPGGDIIIDDVSLDLDDIVDAAYGGASRSAHRCFDGTRLLWTRISAKYLDFLASREPAQYGAAFVAAASAWRADTVSFGDLLRDLPAVRRIVLVGFSVSVRWVLAKFERYLGVRVRGVPIDVVEHDAPAGCPPRAGWPAFRVSGLLFFSLIFILL